MERDKLTLLIVILTQNFNSHAHVERDCNVATLKIFICYFNSHAHVERDAEGGHVILDPSISTHTLTWSVTCVAYMAFLWLSISTHTLTWSVTVGNGLCALYIIFQLTRSRGA